MPPRRDELGAVGQSLVKMNALLLDKDSSLRATLAERERAVAELTRANEDLAARDARARAYAEFVRELKTLDVGALAAGGLQSLVRLADAQVGVVYLLDDADRLVPVHASAADGRAIHHRAFGAEGLPEGRDGEARARVPARGRRSGEPLPKLDLGIGTAPLRWVLGLPDRARRRGRGRDGPRRHPRAERRQRRRARRRPPARRRAAQRVDARPAAREERRARPSRASA